MSARVATFRLPPILAIFAGLFLAGLALFSAMALVAISVVAGLGHLILGRLRSLWGRPASTPGDVLTVEYEVVRDDHRKRPELEERANFVDAEER